MSLRKPTKPQVNRYAESFVLYGDKSKALLAAFPKTSMSSGTLNTAASAYHKLLQVCCRVEELQNIAKTSGEDEFDLSVGQLKKTLSEVMEKGLGVEAAKGSKGSPPNLGAVVSAVAELNRMDGNHAAVKHAIGGADDLPPIPVEITRTIVKSGS